MDTPATPPASSDIPACVRPFFTSLPDHQRQYATYLRTYILFAAKDTPGVGKLSETLKWGQPSYQTEESGTGTPIRINWNKDTPFIIELLVHCQTSLVDTWRAMFEDTLSFSGNRAILLDTRKALPAQELSNCIRMALTYHAAKRRSM